MSINVSFYLGNWEPLAEIVRAGGGPESIWNKNFNTDHKKTLAEVRMSDAHDHYNAWQAVAEIYRKLASRIEDEDQAVMLEELFDGFGIIGNGPDDLLRIEDLEVTSLPRDCIGTGTYSISPDSVRDLRRACSDLNVDEFRDSLESVLDELRQSNDLTWISSIEEFDDFVKGLMMLLKDASRWSAGIVMHFG